MTAQPDLLSSDRPIAVILVDDDLIFRTGLRVWLQAQVGVEVVGDTDQMRTAIALIGDRLEPPDAEVPEGIPPERLACVVVVGLMAGRSPAEGQRGMDLCLSLRARFADLPLLLLGPGADAAMLQQAQAAGAVGYVLRSDSPEAILAAIQRVAGGESAWPSAVAMLNLEMSQPPQQILEPETLSRPLALLRRSIRRSGVRQIDKALDELLQDLNNPRLVGIDRLITEGRCRELRTARWLVQRLLATPSLPDAVPPSGVRLSTGATPAALEDATSGTGALSAAGTADGSRDAGGRLVRSPVADEFPDAIPVPGGAMISAGAEAALFDGLMAKLQGSLRNLTGIPLELDILKENRKRELLYIAVRSLIRLLGDLRQSQVTPRQVLEGRSQILRDLWQRVADDFFGKYYAIQVDALEVEVVTLLQADADVAQALILDPIPYATELLGHLLFQDPLVVNGVPYAMGTPDAMMQAEVLLDHLVIQVANSVIQPLLNRLGDVEPIKQSFYDQSLMSSREIARFRNDLSWRYRYEQLIGDPTRMFESRYQLWVLQGNGIKTTSIYAPRRHELETLQGIPFWVTLTLEFRDAVAPRLRAVISFVGSGLIYLLTDVIGRGIGLIVRGIIKGIGSAWQDVSRYGRDTNQRRL